MGKWEVDVGYIREWLDEQDDRTVAYIWAALSTLSERGQRWEGHLSIPLSIRVFPT